MKNSLHLFKLSFLATVFPPLCCAMVYKIHIQNDSCKKYELTCEEEFHELPARSQRIIPLVWLFSKDNSRGEANVEFYDCTDFWYEECKKRKFCSLILYSHIVKFESKKKSYTAKLEQKRPHIATIRDISASDLCGIQTLKLIINDDLEASELKLDD